MTTDQNNAGAVAPPGDTPSAPATDLPTVAGTIAINDLRQALHQLATFADREPGSTVRAQAAIVTNHIDLIITAIKVAYHVRSHGWWHPSDYAGWWRVELEVPDHIEADSQTIIAGIKL